VNPGLKKTENRKPDKAENLYEFFSKFGI